MTANEAANAWLPDGSGQIATMRARKLDTNASKTNTNITLPRVLICLRGNDQNAPSDERI